MNPIIHSENSMKKFNGKTDKDFNQFLAIHKKMDCSKMYFSDNRHRALTHHMFWVNEVMLEIFGDYVVLSDGRKISVKDICEQHILEDFRMKFIPTVQDYLQDLPFKEWIKNGSGIPDSAKEIYPELIKEDIVDKWLKPPLPNEYIPFPSDFGTKIID